MATSPDVETLERETAEARARLANTLEKLTSPATAQAVKQELTDYAEGLKNQALGYVQTTKDNVLSSGRGKAEGYADSLRQKALANPLGLALIGAGIGWHLYKKPPITTLLIGAGIAALMKGGGSSQVVDRSAYRDPYDPVQPRGYVPGGVAGYGYPVGEAPPGSGLADKASAAANAAGLRATVMAHDLDDRARHAAAQASERVSGAIEGARTAMTGATAMAVATVGEAAEKARSAVLDTAETVKTTVSDAVSGVRTTASETVGGVRTAASDLAERTGSTMAQARSRIAHTADDARHRASGLGRDAQTNPLVLGALGVAVGTALVYSLRSSETGERFVTGTRRAADQGSRRMRSGSGSVARRTARSARDMASSTGEGLGDAVGRAGDMASDIASTTAERMSGVTETAASITGSARETLSSSASGAYEAASSAVRSAAGLAASAGRRAPEAADRVQRQLSELGGRYPLLLGAVSLAVGAAVGGSMRLSESENRMMGPISDRLKQRAREVADEQLGVAREAAEHFAGEIGTQLRSVGQPQDPSADFETVIGGGKPAATAPGEGQQARP